ncbi:pyruvate kinase [Flagellimonas sp. HMM57]|uniref:pyruvate kinase n=1 Tax=unclassified Flagellimonas TaxID=2644544 RepID=UPI0013D3AAAC|nr:MULTISPECIES: pyruvate kinase [unclassified Flagellimonas]UII74782.1 pyruvate kinase [Flagellimonas sp. HMM57]
MKFKSEEVSQVIEQLDTIILKIRTEEEHAAHILEAVDAAYRKSAQNLLHYNVLRSFDLRDIQKNLRKWGLTRFTNDESHIMASLQSTRFILANLIGSDDGTFLKDTWSIKKGKRLLAKHTKELLGYRSKGRRVRIMVTQPTAAAYDYEMVLQMVKEGMNCARINCAHDTPEVWEKIIANVRRAAKAQGKTVKIAMDLAGPKIRTGQMAPGPKVRRFKAQKDVLGQVVHPAEIILVDETGDFSGPNILPIVSGGLDQLKVDDHLQISDARGKQRTIYVVRIEKDFVVAHCKKTIYVETGMMLNRVFGGLYTLQVGELPETEQSIVLKKGDVLEVTKTPVLGQQSLSNEDGQLSVPARISCQMPEVFDYIREGERVLFDDGKIQGEIVSASKDLFEVRIDSAKENGDKLKAFKGMNFPDSRLGFSGLTEKDKKDLPFVVEHADIINFSFVNRPEDVSELHEELQKLNVFNAVDVILKIETKYAYDNLVPILLEAMKSKQVGVMIARGDLAVETGWDKIGNIQQEMLSLCAAAHIPVVWATQVLENLAKKGLPSRSEITDATTALKAECVMLNKGPFINEAIQLLHTILSSMESSRDKKEVLLPKMEILAA